MVIRIRRLYIRQRRAGTGKPNGSGQKGVKSQDEDFVNANGQDPRMNWPKARGRQLIMMLLP